MNFFSGWLKKSVSKIGFEDVKIALSNPHNYVLINTMPEHIQDCLIPGTIMARDETAFMDHLLENKIAHKRTFILYGKNASDDTVYKKHDDLVQLGIEDVHVYSGGLFEWLLLQDIYGADNFGTTQKNPDLLKYREPKRLDRLRIA
jgi:hypothetical protein